ncbi:DUF881 domain-containing protein [Bifidobacterium samirii]|uniref:DUF881 domain-containing protein n=1 Tax=Bifidobacterium samirii TaxID=2306974 RepID=UPI000F7F7F2B|nr:DUF881 domain-containing protein [Bifidobacterium samirii]
MSTSSGTSSDTPSFPVPEETASVRRRSVFSREASGLESHHATPASAGGSSRVRRRRAHDDSLRLIDDLTNRPMDPLFSDARLTQRPTTAFGLWSTRIIVFVICVAVGFFGSLFIQQLHTDPRKSVRQNWASELRDLNAKADTLAKEVSGLQAEVSKRAKDLNADGDDTTTLDDEMTNGMLAVTGEGITLTIADPLSAGTDSTDGSLPRENAGTTIRVVTDADLQSFVMLLWQSGAEAIAVNGYRIGVRTSIRTAGQTIMVGVNPVQSPYRIEAIGDRDRLARAVGSDAQPLLYEAFQEAGIYPQVSKSKSLTLDAAASGSLTYARKGD